MNNSDTRINGQQYPRTDVSLLIADLPQAIEITGIDYTDGAEASLHLAAGAEATLVGLLGRDPFRKSFDITVAFASSSTSPLQRDRLLDCRLKGIGYHPTRLSVLFVEHASRSW